MIDFDEALPTELRLYFGEAVPFLFQELSDRDDRGRAERFECRAGASASGAARLSLQRTFVRWQARHAMESLFAALRIRLEVTLPGAFDRAVDAWIDTHRATSGDPASIGAGFDEMLARDASMPAWAAELADLLWLRVHLRQESSQYGLVPHAVRFYQHRPYTTEPQPGAWVAWLDDAGALELIPVGASVVRVLAERRGELSSATSDDHLGSASLLGRLQWPRSEAEHR
jgi:hypothetical protein